MAKNNNVNNDLFESFWRGFQPPVFVSSASLWAALPAHLGLFLREAAGHRDRRHAVLHEQQLQEHLRKWRVQGSVAG